MTSPRPTLLLLLCALAGLPAQAQSYSVLVAGRIAGKETHVVEPGGAVRVSYSYNDRGRGPEITGRYVFDRDGLPSAIELSGKDYNKAPVDERFAVQNGIARWKNGAEAGESKSRGWYVTARGSPSETAWLARALLKSRSLPLLPAGEASLERGPTLSVAAHGQSLHVTLYAVTGIGFTPAFIWLDERNEFFASPGSFSLVREGWEEMRSQLQEAETAAGEARFHDLALRLAHRPAKGLVIRHVRLFDSETASVREDHAVTVAGNRITRVTRDSDAAVPAGAEVIDAAGKTLLPGLFDMHVHFEAPDGLLDIACGVTSVRDLGNDMDTLLRMKRRMDAHDAIGPRIILAGVMDGRGPLAAPTNVLVDTEDEARAAIDRYAAAGYIQIKIYSSIRPDLVPYIVRAAHAKGMRVSGHVPAGMIADQFVDAGVDEIQHMNFVFLNFLPAEAPNTASRARLTLIAEHGAALDQTSSQVAGFIAKLKDRRIVVDPTLGVFEGQYTARPGAASPSYAAILERLPVQMRRAAFQGGLPVPEGKDRLYRDSFQAMLDMTLRLYRAGVPLVIGTDGVPGLMLHRELELWVQAGIPAADVLRMATLGAARVAGVDRDLGSIAEGKLADMVLVDGDPVRAISDIRKTETVIRDGVIHRSSDLCRVLGMK
ncbi:MAG: amidohydrolase family protein [Bryobacteraceae bacterium]|jgi:imidazolonepropionase-like amidohydrolase